MLILDSVDQTEAFTHQRREKGPYDIFVIAKNVYGITLTQPFVTPVLHPPMYNTRVFVCPFR